MIGAWYAARFVLLHEILCRQWWSCHLCRTSMRYLGYRTETRP